jgi:hypothetical protein
VNIKLLLHLQIVLTFFYFVKLKEWVKEGARGLQTATIDHRRPSIAAIAFFSAPTSLGPIPDPTDQVQLPGLSPVFPNLPS